MPEAFLANDHMLDFDGITAGTGGDWPAITVIEGLSSTPEYRTTDEDRPQEHGTFQVGSDYMQSRIVDVEIGAEIGYGVDQQTMIDNIKGVMRPRHEADEMVLRVRYRNEGVRRLKCRPRRCEIIEDEVLYHGILKAKLRFECGDPRIYEDDAAITTLVPATTAGGLSFPHAFAHGFGATTGSISTVTNVGNIPTPVWGRVTALGSGINSWAVENQTTGKRFGVTMPMNGGDFMDFNFDDKTVLLGGTASRNNAIDRPSSSWWLLYPGDSSVNFIVDPIATGTAELTLFWRSAWV
jgi:hypothetical protein